MRKEIYGCMKCGSDSLEANPGGAYAAQTDLGMSGAVGGQMLCRKCGNFGLPLTFDSEKVRAEYAKSKAGAPKKAGKR